MPNVFETQLIALPANPTGNALPLVHSTDWARFLAITRVGNFQTGAKCPVYDEYLLYTFYGRPAYRLRDDGVAYHNLSYMPVCFVLNPGLIASSLRIMPFDSGGFDLYGPAMHPSFTRKMFEMAPEQASANRVINAFWGSNKNYADKNCPSNLTFAATSELLTHYYQLITNKISSDFDDRCSTLEIQLPVPLGLKGNVAAIAVPVTSDPIIADLARDLGAELLPYNFEMPYYVNDFHMNVRQIVRDFLEAKGLI